MSGFSSLVDGSPADSLPLRDPAIGNGLAVFEVLRTYGGRPFRLPEHLGRLRDSAGFMGLSVDADRVAEEIARVLPAHTECAITVLVTGGGHRVVRSQPLDPARVGAPLRLATLRCTPPPWLPGWVKHTNRAGWVLAARAAGADEVCFVDDDGSWTEANRSNLFAVRNGVLLTPPDDGRILRGVTRAALIEAARAIGTPVREEPVPAGRCDELYCASTLKELAPVVELDGVALPGAGPIGRAVHAAFRSAAIRHDGEAG